MALKKFLSLDRLSEYDGLIKGYITNALKGKSDSGHNHNDIYYTETEINTKLAGKSDTNHNHDGKYDPAGSASGVQTNLNTHTGNSDIHVTTSNKSDWNTAYTHSQATHAPTNAERNIIVGIQKNGTDVTVDSSTRKVNITVPTKASDIGAATSGHNHDDKYDAKGAASSALTSAKSYADEKVANLLNNSTEAVDSIMELAAAMEDNADAIEALNGIASGKADSVHKHEISDVNGLQSALDGKAASSHGTHVTFSTTAPVMDGTASVGTATTVARSDHKHPTDTSRASATDLSNHIADTTKHITSTERTNWGAAYTHSQADHAPSNAQANVIESVKVNGTALTISSKSVNITVPTKASDIGASATGHKHETSDINGLDTALTQTATSISGHTTRIGNLETKVGDGFAEITSAEIQALFE